MNNTSENTNINRLSHELTQSSMENRIQRNRQWSAEIVCQEIRAWHEAQKPLYSHYMRLNYQELLAAGIRYFKTWKLAVEASGIAYDSVRKYKDWTKESIVAKILELQRQGVDLSFRSMMLSKQAPMVYASIRPHYFGSWRKALEAAGIASQDIYRYRSWSDETILSEIRRLHLEGKDLSSKQMDSDAMSLIATARRRFGAWSVAIERAGLDYSKIRRRKRWSQDEIIKEVKNIIQAHGTLSGTKARKLNPALYSAATKTHFFGSWKNAVIAAKESNAAAISS